MQIGFFAHTKAPDGLTRDEAVAYDVAAALNRVLPCPRLYFTRA
jgi:hypothetical protein